ncbi:MAG: ComEC/Rec2 family competence protein, partial [Roseburia sp.]|nr:ComEC/Rec2 family competence protein [Roseburia sp.]
MLRRPFCGMAAGFLLGVLIAAYGGKLFWPAALVCCLVGTGLLCVWKKFEIEKCMSSAKCDSKMTGKTSRDDKYVLSVEKRLSGNGYALLRKGEENVAANGRIQWKVWLRVVLIILAMFFGWQRYTAEQHFREQYLPYLEDNMQLSVQGKLVGKEIRYDQYIYELTSCVIQSDQIKKSMKEPVSCNRILVYSDSDFASIGEILVLEGKVELWNVAVNEGNFDEKSFYEARKKDFKLKDIQVKGVYGEESLWREGLWQLRERLKDIYAEAMGEETGGILVNMVLGDKGLLDQEIKRFYQVAGLSHIMAISGLHISVIGMSLYQFLRRRGLGFTGAGAVAGTVMYVYGTMVGMGTSAQRAVLMFLLQLLAQALGRGYDSLNGLGVAALVLLWENPFLLWDAGFRFSFAAVIGVVWVGKLPRRQGEKKIWEEKLFPSMAIQLATLPLAAWYYYEIPVYAIAVNLVVLPAMGVLLTLGVIGGLAGLLAGMLAKVVLFPCKLLLGLSTKLCSICAELPGAMLITGKP